MDNGTTAGWIALVSVSIWFGVCIALGATGILAAVQRFWERFEPKEFKDD